MPYLTSPEPRHGGRAERTVERHGKRITIGVIYDPSQVPPRQLDEEFTEQLSSELRQAYLALDRKFRPWDAVERLMARYPGHVLPHPELEYPAKLSPPWWCETEEERRKREQREERKKKAAYIAETGDWDVDGEGTI